MDGRIQENGGEKEREGETCLYFLSAHSLMLTEEPCSAGFVPVIVKGLESLFAK